MIDLDHLDRVRGDAPHCLGIAWLAGAPLAVIVASGEPGGPIGRAAPSWAAVAQLAPIVLRDGPVASPEVLMHTGSTMLLLTERPTGVVAVVVAVSGTSVGVALVQARMLAAKVSVREPAEAAS
jgi:hypothetical protein